MSIRVRRPKQFLHSWRSYRPSVCQYYIPPYAEQLIGQRFPHRYVEISEPPGGSYPKRSGLLECQDHSPACSLHAFLCRLPSSSSILCILFLLAKVVLCGPWVLTLFHGSHTHRKTCFLSFLRCTNLRWMCDDPNRCKNLAWKGLRSRGQAVSMTLIMCHIIVLKLTNKDTAKRPLLAPLLEIFTSFPCIHSHTYTSMPAATGADQAFR